MPPNGHHITRGPARFRSGGGSGSSGFGSGSGNSGSSSDEELRDSLGSLKLSSARDRLRRFGFAVVGEKSVGLRASQPAVLSSLLLKRRILNARKAAYAEKLALLKQQWATEDGSAAAAPVERSARSSAAGARAAAAAAAPSKALDETMASIGARRAERAGRGAAAAGAAVEKLAAAAVPSASFGLTPEQIKRVDETFALSRQNPRRVLAEAFKIELSGSDFLTLGPRQWLNDNVIDMFLQIVVTRLAAVESAVFTTQFFTKLESDGYAGVRRWAIRKKLDVFGPRLVFVPVNQNNVHWSLAVIDNGGKTLSFYDSLPSGKGARELRILSDYLREEAKRLKRPPGCVDEYTLVPNAGAPVQSNSFDCGVFMCEVVHRLARELPLEHSQQDMPMLRKYMAFCLVAADELKTKL